MAMIFESEPADIVLNEETTKTVPNPREDLDEASSIVNV